LKFILAAVALLACGGVAATQIPGALRGYHMKRLQAMEQQDTPLMRLLAKAASPYIDVHATLWGGDGCRPHDAVAAGAALWPELFTFEPACLELDPDQFGRLRRTDGAPNAELCVAIETSAVTERLATALFG